MSRTWHDSVLDAVVRASDRRSGDRFSRADLLRDELIQIVSETQSRGATPPQTLSRVLQELRDEGLVQFLGNGSYRLLGRPVHAELADYTSEDLDSLITKGLLRLGQVETGTKLALARVRNGQDRIRALTLSNYSGHCALCDVADPRLLIASHIVPWAADTDARGKLNNVICLCRFHDALFELGYWSMADDYRILIHARTEGEVLKLLLPQTLSFRCPIRSSPEAEYLQWHRGQHGLDR